MGHSCCSYNVHLQHICLLQVKFMTIIELFYLSGEILYSSTPSVLALTAVRHRVEGSVIAQQPQNDIMVTIR